MRNLRTASGLHAARNLLVVAQAPVETFPIYLFIFIVFLNRYVFGFYLTVIRRKSIDETIEGFEPTVTVVVPLFNEGRSIYDTIKALAALEYPGEKLSITIVVASL